MARFASGMAVGLAVGTAACYMTMTKKKSGKKILGKLLKTAGDMVEEVSNTLGW